MAGSDMGEREGMELLLIEKGGKEGVRKGTTSDGEK